MCLKRTAILAAAVALLALSTAPAFAADLTITAANVKPGASAAKSTGVLAATETAGQVVYLDANKKFALADSNGSAAAKVPTCILLSGGGVDQPATCAKSGDVTIGATLSPGAPYYLSDTAGGIAPWADVGAGEAAVLVGVAKSSTVLTVLIKPTGATL